MRYLYSTISVNAMEKSSYESLSFETFPCIVHYLFQSYRNSGRFSEGGVLVACFYVAQTDKLRSCHCITLKDGPKINLRLSVGQIRFINRNSSHEADFVQMFEFFRHKTIWWNFGMRRRTLLRHRPIRLKLGTELYNYHPCHSLKPITRSLRHHAKTGCAAYHKGRRRTCT